MDGWSDRQAGRWTDEETGGRVDGQTNRQVDGWMDERTGRWVSRQMDRWMGGIGGGGLPCTGAVPPTALKFKRGNECQSAKPLTPSWIRKQQII